MYSRDEPFLRTLECYFGIIIIHYSLYVNSTTSLLCMVCGVPFPPIACAFFLYHIAEVNVAKYSDTVVMDIALFGFHTSSYVSEYVDRQIRDHILCEFSDKCNIIIWNYCLRARFRSVSNIYPSITVLLSGMQQYRLSVRNWSWTALQWYYFAMCNIAKRLDICNGYQRFTC